MALKKIPKKIWLKMSKEDQDYWEFEYKKAFEKRMRLTVISTRAIALLCVIVLFFIGFVMLNAVQEYGQVRDKYGKDAFCYLCGLESLKKCECQYNSMYEYDDYQLTENYSIELAEYNSKQCQQSKIIGSQGKTELPEDILWEIE